MTHEQLWRALDTLAAEKGLSPSGLARLAGLDPTSFNRSKRVGARGPRWPSTESLSRVLAASGVGLDAFAALVAGGRVLSRGATARSPTLPVLLFSRLALQGVDAMLDDRERMVPPVAAAAPCYLLRMDSDRFEPALRQGGLLVVSPDAAVLPGDRAIAFTASDAVACVFSSPALLRLDDGAPLHGTTLLHRIDWVGL